MIDFVQQESKAVHTPVVGAGHNTIPERREDTRAKSGGAARVPVAVSLVNLQNGAHTVLNCCLYVLFASRYLSAKP